MALRKPSKASALNSGEILVEAGLDVGLLKHRDRRAPTEKVSRLWRIAAEKLGDPAIGPMHPQAPKPGNFNIVAYAIISSRSLRVALQNFSRHLRLVSDAASTLLPTPPASGRNSNLTAALDLNLIPAMPDPQ